ncbi:MAG: VWA domain-containing protein [Lentisphaeria bacterium]|nr:VWA domain-containing protein [Lentisphaeria bacterium]
MLRFESPWCLLALIVPVGLWAWRWWRRRRKAGVRFSSVSHAKQAGRSWRQRLQWLPTALGDVALILLVVCLARPQAGNERVHDVSEGVAIEMVLDRSGSMEQELNFEGRERTRLEVVKEVFQRFVYGDGKSLEGRPNDLIGIISFARYAETACPLTLSQKVLKTLVNKIDLARDQSENGTAIGEALALAIARLHTADETLAKQLKKQKMDYHIKSKVIILLTDGENNVGRKVESVIDLAVKCGVRVHVICISGNGMMVVQTPFGTKKLPVRQPPLDTRELKALAEKTGGSFQMAATAERLLEIYADIDKMERTKIETIRFVDYKELFQPLALTALGLVVMKLLLEASLFRRLP